MCERVDGSAAEKDTSVGCLYTNRRLSVFGGAYLGDGLS